MTTSTGPHVPQPTRVTGADALPLVRGLLAEALRRCPPTSDAALELCAAWEHLEEAGELPDVVDPAVAASVPTVTVLGTARDILCTGIATIEPARRALALAAAVRHIRTALEELHHDRTDRPAAS